MNTKAQRGFTLYELLVTVLVAGVILGIGVPNLLEFSRNNRITATANDLISSLYLARSEAVKQRAPVTLCASPEPLIANPSCDPTVADPDSEGGYIVWLDTDADANVDGGEQILLQRDDPQDIVVFGDNGYVNFGMNGNVADIAGVGASATRILFCDTRGNVVVSGTLSAARAIRIDPTGRSSVLNEVATVAPVVTALGAACP
jgi:type IV fimbrial biogenesis protein FimT